MTETLVIACSWEMGETDDLAVDALMRALSPYPARGITMSTVTFFPTAYWSPDQGGTLVDITPFPFGDQ